MASERDAFRYLDYSKYKVCRGSRMSRRNSGAISLRNSKRLRPQERIDQLIDIAAREIDRQNHLPIHYGRLADIAGVTPQLIYKYFRDDTELYIRIVDEHLDLIEDYLGDAVDAEVAIEQYCEFLIDHGCAMSIILAHPHICTQLPTAVATRFHALLRKYSRAVRRQTQAGPRQSLLFLLSAAAVPEEFSRLHRADRLSVKLARKYSAEMVGKGLASL